MKSKKKHYLSIVAIFKNESHCIKEWIEHYINEGVDHFYLIDNGSTDNYQKEIESFLDQGLITLFHDDTKWAQASLYNKYFLPERDNSTWYIVCDLDEFIYARSGFETIKEFLELLPPNAGAVRIPWKMFGSSGIEDQPKSIVESFTKRESYETKPYLEFFKAKKGHSKAIIKTKNLKSFRIHSSEMTGKYIVFGPNQKKLPYPSSKHKKNFQPISEKLLSNSFLHLNHYAIQSKNWFLEVKCTRGAADSQKFETIRNLEYFIAYDQNSNEVIDDELAKKRSFQLDANT